QKFHQLTGIGKKQTTVKDFIESKLYNDFVRFGKWINEGSILKPEKYMDYLITGKFKIKDWTKESVYHTYLRSILLKESPSAGLQRSIEWIQNWSKENNIPIEQFLETVSTFRLVDVIRSGRISPWLILISNRTIL